MKKYLILTVILSLLVAMPVVAQYGPGWRDDYGWGQGRGMGGGMMGYPIAPDVPDKLPVPKSREWAQKLREVLALERLSYAQYTADAEKFNAYMPYYMVIPQEEDHVRAFERLFAAYGMPAEGEPAAVLETKTITEAFELCVKMEQEQIPRYEWLVKNAVDRDSAGILNRILLQTRHHLVMFDHALRMGGGMGPGMMQGGGYGYGMGPGMMGGRGYGYGMGGGMMGEGRGEQPYPPENEQGTGKADRYTIGKNIYDNRCQACHGIKGDGRGPASYSMSPGPADFTDPQFWKNNDDHRIGNAIRYGRGMMPAFNMTPGEIDAVISYMKKSFEKR
jgi:mono/diheme cytochrome c family protein/rubrerythrin